jgi:hypothetical protein
MSNLGTVDPVQSLADATKKLGQPNAGGVSTRDTRIAETTTIDGDAGRSSVSCTIRNSGNRDTTFVEVTASPNSGSVEAGVVGISVLPQGPLGTTIPLTRSGSNGAAHGGAVFNGARSAVVSTGGVTVGTGNGTAIIPPSVTNCSREGR